MSVHRKVKPIYLELTNERGQIFAIIHGTNLKLQFSTTECILSLLFDPGTLGALAVSPTLMAYHSLQNVFSVQDGQLQ